MWALYMKICVCFIVASDIKSLYKNPLQVIWYQAIRKAKEI